MSLTLLSKVPPGTENRYWESMATSYLPAISSIRLNVLSLSPPFSFCCTRGTSRQPAPPLGPGQNTRSMFPAKTNLKRSRCEWVAPLSKLVYPLENLRKGGWELSQSHDGVRRPLGLKSTIHRVREKNWYRRRQLDPGPGLSK